MKDRVPIVTGGGGGMGTGISLCLARAGANIVVSDVNLEAAQGCVEKIEETGQRGLAVQSDVTKEADCTALVEKTLKTFGQVDILVNNAGHFGENLGLPFTNQTEDRLG